TPNAICAANFFNLEAALQYITGHGLTMVRISGLGSPTQSRARAQARFTHQAGDPLAPATPATGTHFAMNARTAIGSFAVLMNGGNQGPQYYILPRSNTRLSSLSGIETRATNLQYATHRSQRKLMAIQSNAGVLHDFSFAKYAAAFFKKSRSSVTRTSSRRKRRNSSSWLVTRPWPRKMSLAASFSTCRFQLRTIDARIPSAAATLATDCPCLTSRTASSLNSRVNCLRFSDMNTSWVRSMIRPFLGVHKINASPVRLLRETAFLLRKSSSLMPQARCPI